MLMCKSSVEYCCCGNCCNTDSVVVTVDESSCYVVLITDVDDLLSVCVLLTFCGRRSF